MSDSKNGVVFLWVLSLIAGVAAIFSYSFLDPLAQATTARYGFRGDVRQLFDMVGSFGHAYFCLFVIISIWCLDPKNRKSILLIVVSLLFAGGITDGIKSLIERPRPAIVAGVPLDTTDSVFGKSQLQSFPSGHTTTAFALATSLALIYTHARGYFFLLAMLVGLQRVITQAHYPSDVLVGAMIGMLGAACVATVLVRYNSKWISHLDSLTHKSPSEPQAI
jgi:membrane-associated phospholipid phosphatase